jgi:hypothetical protein
MTIKCRSCLNSGVLFFLPAVTFLACTRVVLPSTCRFPSACFLSQNCLTFPPRPTANSYYRSFIVGFSNIDHPIASLQKKGTKFEWTPKYEENFNLLKELLTSALVLKIDDPNESFVVCTDACKEGIGGVLIQNEHVIGYESKNIKEHERNYATHDLELASIVHSLKMWRNYLMGKIFELRT